MSDENELIESVDALNGIQLESKLREVEEQLRREMRNRGFDPDQRDNLAFTAPLAKLYAERETLKTELEEQNSESVSAGIDGIPYDRS